MSFQEYVNEYFGWWVDLNDLCDEDLDLLQTEYEREVG